MKKREDGINREEDFFACIVSLILVLILLFSCYLISSSPSSLCSSFYSRGESNTDTGEVVMVKTRVRQRERGWEKKSQEMDRKTKETTSTTLLLTLNGYPFYFPILSFSSLLLRILFIFFLFFISFFCILIPFHPLWSSLCLRDSFLFFSTSSIPFVVRVVLLLYLISFRISSHWLISIEICFRSVCFPFSYLPSDTILVTEALLMLNTVQKNKRSKFTIINSIIPLQCMSCKLIPSPKKYL